MRNNSFIQQDYIAAEQAILSSDVRTNETTEELMLRQRKAELRNLVKKVIKNELTPQQQLIVKMHWYDSMSQSSIAEELGIEPSKVSRELKKINNTVFEKLKYAVEFRYGKSSVDTARLIITNKEALNCCIYPNEISARIAALRKNQCLSVEDVSRLSGIDTQRLLKFEKDGSKISVLELKKLAVLFSVTCDYILFGKRYHQA